MTVDVPSISVIVPVRNEAAYIQATLTQIASQNYPQHLIEVIVVDGQSSDDTVALARQTIATLNRPTWRVIDNPKRLASAARNIGIASSSGEYILIIDGHVHLPNALLLSSAADAIQRTGALVLGRPQRLSPPNISAFQTSVASVRASRIGHGRGSLIYSDAEGWVDPSSIAVMYHRSLFDQFGKFDETFDAAEDFEFNSRLARAGVKCWTSPTLEVLYFPRGDYTSLFRQMQRYGIGRTRFIWRHRDTVSLDALIPAAALLVGGVATLLAPLSESARILLAAICITYILLVVGYSCFPGWPGIQEAGRRLLIGATIHAGLGWGVLKELFSLIAGGTAHHLPRD